MRDCVQVEYMFGLFRRLAPRPLLTPVALALADTHPANSQGNTQKARPLVPRSSSSRTLAIRHGHLDSHTYAIAPTTTTGLRQLPDLDRTGHVRSGKRHQRPMRVERQRRHGWCEVGNGRVEGYNGWEWIRECSRWSCRMMIVMMVVVVIWCSSTAATRRRARRGKVPHNWRCGEFGVAECVEWARECALEDMVWRHRAVSA